MPPGAEYQTDERAPDGVLYFRIYGAIFALFYGMFVVAGGGMFVAPLFVDRGVSGGAGAEVGFYLAGLLYGGVGLLFAVPTIVALFGGRRPWVHTLGTVVIALGMINFCCLPVLIPLLIVWMKPETRRWFGAT
jgi:hypothetical protein